MRARVWFVALVCGVVSMGLLGTAEAVAPLPGSNPRSVADVDVAFDCVADGWRITSTKDLSNIVYDDGNGHHRIEFGAPTQEFLLVADDVSTIWVKSGNNRSGDGPGYGERFDVTEPPCDRDGDGFTDDVDCDDADPSVNPGQTDVPNDGIDQNCDGADLVVGDGQVRVTLTWGSDDDVDLHVIEPDGTRIAWYQPASPSGGTLDRDDNVGVCGADPEPGGVENAFWPDGEAPTGTYTVEVRSYIDCVPAGTTFHLQVFVDGVVVVDETGTASGGAGGSDDGVLAFSTTFSVA